MRNGLTTRQRRYLDQYHTIFEDAMIAADLDHFMTFFMDIWRDSHRLPRTRSMKEDVIKQRREMEKEVSHCTSPLLSRSYLPPTEHSQLSI